MKNIHKLLFSFLAIFIFVNHSNAQLKRVYNEQQLIVLEQQGLLDTIDESQISEKAKESKIYKRFKGISVEDPRFRKRKKCAKKED